ncbi:ABC transporter permease subunit [Aquabacter spiritensis]|uniref:Amino acid/amide ABC transporter membrane protein 2 (HAAT family) /amino acid/amide ABC transporter ATP-binding protein 1 (HAAT family) n=1 Tax=Aquabacter spiritensis TaxID=933073 RepID=A0A4R3LX39_9HYPH|nr:branched-chain amino acid ABC transporter ATP-binding protein/permease [Aquabacter spiritensis]TCT04349.1 amino acid/amide ABC transporter membrane protein 2 (HAAT family) /amino acid/amide ABC transporter ATP-binding protein 1 (HAAT family) [Aquabacter spiritensis]
MLSAHPRRVYLAVALLAALYVAAIFLTTNSYYQLMLALVPVWAVMGLSWNVFSGYSGLVSFGHAAFFGLGAYTTTLLFAKLDVTPWLGIPAAALVGSLAGLLIGAITFRLRGHYFALAMLAYPLAMLYVFEWAGLQEVSFPMKREDAALFMQFHDQRWNALIALGLLVIALLVSLKVERSRFGLSLLAIKQNEIAAEVAGIDSYRWKLKAIAVSGALAGAAGGFYAVVLLVVTPFTVFGLATSAQALIVTMFGGVGTVWGPIVGAAILVPVAEILHAELGGKYPGIQGVVFGLAIILVMMKMPQGIVWAVRDRFFAGAGRPAAVGVAPPPARAPAFLVAEDAEVLLAVTGLSRRFGGVKALTDVTLQVRRQEILGIIGPNGAGKTTLFNVLNGLVAPDAGSIRLAGRPLDGLPANRICARGVGRTFQVARVFARMSLIENVVVGAFVGTGRDAAAIKGAQAALTRVGLGGLAAAPADTLTNYELRLMELARALAGGPDLLLLDEPFAGLDAAEVRSFMALLRTLRDEGMTIAIIEHTMQAMVQLVDRFVVLDHGCVIADGPPREVVRDRAVITAYLGDKWVPDAVA